MKTHIKILLWPNYTKKDRTRPLYLRVNINRKFKYYTLNISCLEKNWNDRKSIVKFSYPENKEKNTLIEYYYKRARDIIFQYQVNGENLTINEFDRQFRN